VPVCIAFPFSITDNGPDNLPMSQHTPDEAEVKAVATYVWFEFLMFTQAAKEILSLVEGKADGKGGYNLTVQEQLQVNVLLASLLIHARNLRYFLFDKPKWDDVSAQHFLPEWDEKVEKWCPYFDENRERLNKSLAHISYKRIEYAPNKGWDCVKIYNEVKAAWNEFWSRLPAAKQKWFNRERDVRSAG